MPQQTFLLAVGVFVLTLITLTTYFVLRARRASRNGWRILLGRLQDIDKARVEKVALDLLDEAEVQSPLDPDLIFGMIGGMAGLAALEQNCDVLIDLATYIQRWYPEALELAEDLRLNTREIRWHISRLRGAANTGHMREQFPIYAQRAIATYYLMTRSLLVLYEGVQAREFAELKQAI